MAIDQDKYRRMFVEEAREGLRALGNDLVMLEKSQATSAGDPARKQIMDSAFRTAHSIKGMAAAVGHPRFAAVAHQLEELADLARQGQALHADGFDLLLEGCDRLSALVEAVAGGSVDPDPGDLASRVERYVATVRGATRRNDVVDTATHLHADGVLTATATTDGIAVRVKIADDASLPQVRAFVVHKALSQLEGYQQTEPPAESLRQKELPDRTLVVRFAAGADIARILAVARSQQGVHEANVVVARAAPATAVEPERKVGGDDVDRTVRVRTALLDEFIDSVGELLLARSKMRALAQKLERPELYDLVDEVDRLTRDLNGRVVAARMSPLAFITETFPRVVRDLARLQKKSVDFQMLGTAIELDRAILDELSAPFLHMLRNAVDHAHEGDEARRLAGKAPTMKLTLSASRDRDNVLLELKDDGGGVDAVRVKARAVQRQLISAASAAALSDAQALELICLPGFSTVENVNETSGRGVGMDVVKAKVERVGGSLKIESHVGIGTRLVLQLPLTVAIIQVLVVEAGNTTDAYTIPVNRVERAVDLDLADVSFANGRTWMRVGEDLVPLIDLAEELGHPPRGVFAAETAAAGTVIMVGRGTELTAVRVDRILGQEEVVAKPLGMPLAKLPYLSGAAILSDGRAALVLEPIRLSRAALPRREMHIDQTTPQPLPSRP